MSEDNPGIKPSDKQTITGQKIPKSEEGKTHIIGNSVNYVKKWISTEKNYYLVLGVIGGALGAMVIREVMKSKSKKK